MICIQLYNRYRGELGFAHRVRGGNISPPRRHSNHSRMSRHNSFSGPGTGMMRFRQPSSTTIASSVSGAVTPDISYRLPPSLASPSPRLFPMGRDGEENRYRPRFVPSDRSAFSQLPALEDDDETRNSFGEDCGDGSSGVDRYGVSEGLNYPPPVRLSPVAALWERQHSLMERRSSLAAVETDEETIQEDELRKRFHQRRASLPVHPLSHGIGGGPKWYFKTRAMPFSNLPVGRVSPLTSDNEHGGAVVKKKCSPQKESLEPLTNRTLSASPPNKDSSSVEEGTRSQSPQKSDLIHRSPELNKQADDDEEEEEEEEEEVSESDGEGEGEGRERALEVEWRIGDVNEENGARAGNNESTKHHTVPPPPSKFTPPTTLPTFHKKSSSTAPNNTSTSTPNSLTRPKHTAHHHTTRLRTPSVPALPTHLLVSSGDFNGGGLPGCLGDYERTLHNARNYMKEFKALVESGSSDQESDPEPTLTTHLKAAQVMEQINTAAKLPALINHHTVTMHKDNTSTDLGFSLSDGFGEPGVYIKSIHSGGLAEINGELKPFDRIMKVPYNNVYIMYILCM